MPPFKIAPWELPPDCDAPLVAPADFVFRSRWAFGSRWKWGAKLPETELWFRTVPYKGAFIHYFYDGAHPRNGNWVLSNWDGHVPFSKTKLESNFLEWVFQHDNDRWFDHIMRLVFFDGAPYGFSETHRLTFAPNGSGLLNSGPEMFISVSTQHAHFHSPFNRRRQSARAVTVRNQLFAALNDEHSELRFALSWIHLLPTERKQRRQRFAQGTFAIIQRLLRAALQSQVGIWEKQKPLFWRTHHPKKSQAAPTYAWEGDLTFGDFRTTSSTPNVGPRLNRWKQVICNYYLPTLEDDWLIFACCVEDTYAPGVIVVEAAPPSAHEQIEAALLLRNWWNQHFPPELFDAHNANDEMVQQ